ncbi:hypothetical protein, partial [Streptosporangium sp. NPDC049046]|uniref:hypothetical protein n=1 Tax=Streptosporangium sp. NPDC049046 TaxID=3155031 RepID=UPI003422413F
RPIPATTSNNQVHDRGQLSDADKGSRFERRRHSRFARLSFAQKVAVYVGLYDPDDDQITLLLRFNRLRNRLAHTFTNLEDATLECLPGRFGGLPADHPDGRGAVALDRVQTIFLYLAFFELGAIRGVKRLDRMAEG